MNATLTNFVIAPYVLAARGFVIILGCLAIWWGIIGFPIYWQDSSVQDVATHIIAGDPFKAETLAQLVPVLDNIKKSTYCRPAALRNTAIIEFRMVEVAASNDRHLASHLTSLSNLIRSSLACAPADPSLWLALYFVEVHRNGFKPDYLKYLRLSYRLGPHEGWIVLKRNPLAFKDFQKFPPDLREDVLNEFFEMLRDGHFADETGKIFVGPAWPERELILSQLARLNDNDRQRFVDELRKNGYDLVPGIGLAPVDSHRFAPLIRVPQ